VRATPAWAVPMPAAWAAAALRAAALREAAVREAAVRAAETVRSLVATAGSRWRANSFLLSQHSEQLHGVRC
jgi:hypothetical protein